jgi:creatinine amidohydrolase
MRSWIPDSRFLPYFTWKEVEALPKDVTLLILPTAAIEQHGHHLPLATDTLLNNYVLGKALELIPADIHIYALAPVCYGKSNEHVGFPGTLSVSSATFLAVLRDIAKSIRVGGFRRIVLSNSHGGNSSLVDVAGRDLREEFDLQMFCLYGGGVKLTNLGAQEAAYGYHAGEVETALLLAATPDLVKKDHYTSSYIRQLGDNRKLVPEHGSATFSWLTRDVSPTGVMGDPALASAENGELWANTMAKGMAESLLEMYHYRNLQKL